MAKRQILTILMIVICFLACVGSVTDKEFEDLAIRVDQQLQQLKEENLDLSNRLDQLEAENKVLVKENERQNALIGQLMNNQRHRPMITGNRDVTQTEKLIQNSTLEDRVELLEIQMVVIQDEVFDLESDVDYLFDQQVIQDEKLLNLEQESDVINGQIEDLQDRTLALDFRVTILEENGDEAGNSSTVELEQRVETLEETAVNHETRISANEADVTELQMIDIQLDERITALEENGGSSDEETIAFNAALQEYSEISDENSVKFDVVLLNEGDGYDSSTGFFTVPLDGDGLYYFSLYFTVNDNESGLFDIKINERSLCSAYAEQADSPNAGHGSCSATTLAFEGDRVEVQYKSGTDSTPLFESSVFYYNGFTGFRI